MIEEKIETEHREDFGMKQKIYGCIYEKMYNPERDIYVWQLKYCWRKD